jgi:hypothetical protein
MVESTSKRGGVSGALTKDGRLTRGGMWLLAALGLLLVAGAATEWRSLATAALGQRLPGTVVQSTPEPGQGRHYRVRVAFEPGGRPVEFERRLRTTRNRRAPLSAGDPVEVVYRPADPERAVLDHAHENWKGAPYAGLGGAALLVLAWYWAPRRANPSGAERL